MSMNDNEIRSDLFKNLTICTTGFTSKDENKISKIIMKYNGKFTRELYKDVNCLIVKKVGSQKYDMALKYNIPCIIEDWLHESIKLCEVQSFSNYISKPFTGLVITCTQISQDLRIDLEKKIIENGGIYSKNLISNTSTHLIAIETTGDKYFYAKNWNNIRILKPEWIEECIKRKRWVQDYDYMLLESSNNTNTKIKDYTIKTAAINENSKTIDQTDINKENITDVDITNWCCNISNLPQLDSSIYRNDVFDNQIFFIFGFSRELTDYIVRLLLSSGAIRHHTLSDEVTIIILGQEIEEWQWEKAKKHPFGKIIKLSYIIESLLNIQIEILSNSEIKI